jgi:hypothetical protein
VDRTFKAIENVRYSAQRYLKGLVVGVATNFTGFHRLLHGTELLQFGKTV